MLWLLFSIANASEIQVSARSPVVVSIDGAPAGIASTLIDTKDLEPGPHRVQIRSFVGSLLAEGSFQLGHDERLRLEYDRRARIVVELDRTPLTSPNETAVTANPTPAVAAPVTAPPAKPPIPLADSPTASLVITGLSDISGEVRIAGVPVLFASDLQGFVALAQPPPVVEVHIQDNGTLRYHGAVELTAGGHTACHLQYRETAWMVECSLTGPELAR